MSYFLYCLFWIKTAFLLCVFGKYLLFLKLHVVVAGKFKRQSYHVNCHLHLFVNFVAHNDLNALMCHKHARWFASYAVFYLPNSSQVPTLRRYYITTYYLAKTFCWESMQTKKDIQFDIFSFFLSAQLSLHFRWRRLKKCYGFLIWNPELSSAL